MAEIDRLIEKLRGEWHRATEKNKPQDALKALIELERLDPKEPAWSQRLGETYRRMNMKKEAVDAFVRAYERYLSRGFLPRAIAMAKLVASMDQARGDLLEKTLPTNPAAPLLASLPPQPSRPAAVPSSTAPAPLPISGKPLQLSSVPREPAMQFRPVIPAPLTPAHDAAADEVRFADAGDSSISVLLTDFSSVDQVVPPEESEPSLTEVSAPPMSISEVTEVDTYGTMATFRLFAALSREALVALAAAADLVEFVPTATVIMKDEKAYAMYAIVSGTARVVIHDNPEIRLGEGDIFGEGTLLEEGLRQADVRAETQLMTLRIEREKLAEVTKEFPEVEAALFDLLARRLITNLMHKSPLFAAFDNQAKLELAQRFEVRRASAGTIVMERNRRADGLYILLAGHVTADSGEGEPILVARGTAFGHSGLMGGKSDVTVTADTEAVLLRMPASQFATLAAHYPPVLAYLAETANEPIPSSVR